MNSHRQGQADLIREVAAPLFQTEQKSLGGPGLFSLFLNQKRELPVPALPDPAPKADPLARLERLREQILGRPRRLRGLEERRLEVARRLADAIPNPVFRARQRRVRVALAEEARLHRESVEKELRARVEAAACEILPPCGGLVGYMLLPTPRQLRAQLNRIVTEDLLSGREWRRDPKRHSIPERDLPLLNRAPRRGARRRSPTAEPYARQVGELLTVDAVAEEQLGGFQEFLDFLNRLRDLPERQREALMAVYLADRDESLYKVAEGEGMNLKTWETHLRRGRQKIREKRLRL